MELTQTLSHSSPLHFPLPILWQICEDLGCVGLRASRLSSRQIDYERARPKCIREFLLCPFSLLITTDPSLSHATRQSLQINNAADLPTEQVSCCQNGEVRLSRPVNMPLMFFSPRRPIKNMPACDSIIKKGNSAQQEAKGTDGARASCHNIS